MTLDKCCATKTTADVTRGEANKVTAVDNVEKKRLKLMKQTRRDISMNI